MLWKSKKIGAFSLLSVIALVTLNCSPIKDENFFEPVKVNNYTFSLDETETGFNLDISYNINSLQRSEVTLESNDGRGITNIVGVYVGDTNLIDENTIIVYCHDKNENIDYYWPRIQLLAKMDPNKYGIFIVDYRGYGKSEGQPSEAGLYADINAALVWLEENGLTSDRLIMYGYGLGSAVAVELTANPRSLVPSKIILEAPMASIESLIQDTTLQATPGSYLSDLEFNNVEKIKNITQPLMWIHGTDDEVYDISSQGKLVYDNHPGTENVNKFAHQIEGASHHNIPHNFDNGFDGYIFNVLTFISLE